MSKLFDPAFWQGLMNDENLQQIVYRGIKIVSIALLYWIAHKIITRVVHVALSRIITRQQAKSASAEQTTRLRTLHGLVKSIVGYILFFVMIVTILQAMSMDVSGLLTTAGIGGVAVGFGAQKLVKDVISGFFLIMEDQFGVGDYVTFNPTTIGTIEEMGLRITRLRDDQGRLVILSNGDISTVINHSRAAVNGFVDVDLAPDTDIERAKQIVTQVGEELYALPDHALRAAPKPAGVVAFNGSWTTLRVEVVADARKLGAEQVRTREALRARFLAEEMPIA